MLGTDAARRTSPEDKGQILAEILLVIAVVAIIAPIAAQVSVLSNRLSASSNERLIMLQLAEEAMEALRAVSQGNDAGSQGWNRLYKPPDGSGDPAAAKGSSNPYRIVQASGIWVLQSGAETVTVSGGTYVRKIVIDNVCRDAATDAIITAAGVPPCTAGNADDPATQKVTVTVSTASLPDMTLTAYFSRYLNEGSRQTDWSGGVNAGPFGATTSFTSVSSSQNADLGNSNCGGAGPCVRLQPQ
ncbi:hypothetical protein HY633_04400 [Candidatus Uhrbacteria bacterium]|nr:hypothetical protein [Candidatus Uhrbacteria bacterium]